MNIHNKKISAVVSDFDGTIIKHGMSIPPKRFFTDIEKLLEKGIPFIAASGRQYANLRRILSPIADRIDFIAENGCLVVHNNKVIHKCTIPRSLAMELIAELRAVPDTEITISAENTLYLCTKNEAYINLLSNKVKNNVTVSTALPHVKEVCDHICENVEDVLEEMLGME